MSTSTTLAIAQGAPKVSAGFLAHRNDFHPQKSRNLSHERISAETLTLSMPRPACEGTMVIHGVSRLRAGTPRVGT